MPQIVVLISGNGSNLQAIIDAVAAQKIPGSISGVISNKADAFGLERAQSAGIPTVVVTANKGEAREDYDQRLAREIRALTPDCIVLAGFMRILSEAFINEFAEILLNVHPSLLPKYRGLNTHQRAIDAGDKEHGCSIHFVTAELDGGPIILQAKVPVFPEDDAGSLAERVQTQERQIYPLVVKWFCEGRLKKLNDKAVLDEKELPAMGFAAD
ncbi:phosphoribosylglycinamide formyltransferase [Alteromonas sp. ASW11-36]|uniref:Phosphoribosylglycinamide formyltransferase n=1 Tax=Alteromonas arenosi TaxID=3055817 RepID=A0ABT7SX52_9ALTE|nr:phosphoribosylglycinamide formyltransferase [Alteromonas sp. ASW11-36]MDM7860769.1 phosphoribosylglycinamide formyltransferase [Alteromonas sp. ASW11-36]